MPTQQSMFSLQTFQKFWTKSNPRQACLWWFKVIVILCTINLPIYGCYSKSVALELCSCSLESSVRFYVWAECLCNKGNYFREASKNMRLSFIFLIFFYIAGCPFSTYWTDGYRKTYTTSVWYWEDSDERIVFPRWYGSFSSSSSSNWLASRRYTGSIGSYTSWGMYNYGSGNVYCYTCEMEAGLPWAYTRRAAKAYSVPRWYDPIHVIHNWFFGPLDAGSKVCFSI